MKHPFAFTVFFNEIAIAEHDTPIKALPSFERVMKNGVSVLTMTEAGCAKLALYRSVISTAR